MRGGGVRSLLKNDSKFRQLVHKEKIPHPPRPPSVVIRIVRNMSLNLRPKELPETPILHWNYKENKFTMIPQTF